MIIFEQLMTGVLLGSQYALISIGLALLFGVMRVTNVAHGDLMTLGGYIALAIMVNWVPNQIAAILGTVLTMFMLGMLLDRSLFKRLRDRGQHAEGALDTSAIVLTLGLSIAISNGILAIWGPNYTRVQPLATGTVDVLGLLITKQRLLAGGIAVLVIAALFLFLRMAKLGLAIRAVSQNSATVRSLGINPDRIYMVTAGIAAALAGVAGVLLAPDFWLSPFMGFRFTVKAIVIVVMGGLGSVTGALIGSLVLGIAESLAVLTISSQFADTAGLLIMMLILLIRPAGLLGRQAAQI